MARSNHDGDQEGRRDRRRERHTKKRRFEPLPKPPTRNQIHELLPDPEDLEGDFDDSDISRR